MAYESWAGGTISSQDTPASRSPHGTYIPIQDVPNAPKTVAMPLARYQDIPAIRHEYLDTKIDMESRGQKMMQKPLPESFEEAGNIRASVAGKGQMAVGKAIQETGASLGKAFTDMGEILAKMRGKALQSKDEMDELRGSAMIDTYNEQTARVYAGPQKDWEKGLKDAGETLRENTASLGSSPFMRDKIQAKVNGILGYTDPKTGQEIKGTEHWRADRMVTQRSMEQDQAFGLQQLQSAMDPNGDKNYAKGYAAIEKLQGIGYYGDDQAKAAREKLAFLENQDTIQAAYLTPQGAMRVRDQAEVVRKGGKSKDFELLNSNPNLAPNVEYEATQKIKQHKIEGAAAIKTRIDSGELSNPADIRQAGKAYGLEHSTVEALVKSKEVLIPMNPSAHKDVQNEINSFDYHSVTAEKDYERIWTKIQTTVDKDHQDFYEKKLLARSEESRDPKGGTAQQNERNQLNADLKVKDDAAMLGDPAKRHLVLSGRRKLDLAKKGEKENGKPITERDIEADQRNKTFKYSPSPEEVEAMAEHDKEVLRLQNKIDQVYEDNPEAEPGDIREKVYKDDPALRNAEKNAGKAAEDQTKPAPRAGFTSPTVATREQRALVQGTPFNFGTPPAAGTAFTGPLQGKEDAFAAAAVKHGIDPLLLMAISMHETGRGESDAVKTANNPGGLMNPATGYKTLIRFRTLEEGIDAMARNLRDNYIDRGLTTIEAIQKEYAPEGAANDPKGLNKDWVSGVTTFYNQLKQQGSASAGSTAGTGGLAAGQSFTGHVNPALTSRFETLKQQFPNFNMTIESGFRSVAHNKRVGGAEHSAHTRGNAIDVNTGHLSHAQRLTVIEAAIRNGITGIGIYNNNIHLDLEGKRMWGHDYTRASVPAWALPTMRRLGYA